MIAAPAAVTVTAPGVPPGQISFEAGPVANLAAAVIVAAVLMAIVKGAYVDVITTLALVAAVFALFTIFSINLVLILLLVAMVMVLKSAAIVIEQYVLNEDGGSGGGGGPDGFGDNGLDATRIARFIDDFLESGNSDTDNPEQDQPPIEQDERRKR